jgi:hypothetical protein
MSEMVADRDDDLEGWDIPEEAGATDEMDAILERVRGAYNRPPETPRDEMWGVIQRGLTPRPVSGEAVQGERAGGAPVLSLEAARAKRWPAFYRTAGWAVAAAALLVLGIGIGRMSAPTPAGEASMAETPDPTAMRLATEEHLGKTESLLTLVKLDARAGQLDPQVGPWARSLLAQTRLLLDAPDVQDPAMRQLLEDLELVLVQIVGVTDAGPHDAARARTELNLAVQGLDDRDVLPRIQALVPGGSGLSGT